MDDRFLLMISEQNQAKLLRKTNEYTNQYGLCLTDDDIQELLIGRRKCLSEQQRVEFGEGVLHKLIFAFCDSDFIDRENYVETIARLQDIFYLYKNESMDKLTDDELIDIMRNAFDKECQGSLEYLEETFLESYARNIRSDAHRAIGGYAGDDSKSDSFRLYTMEDLLPIVVKLTEEFTAKESSSVTYERARQFMEAVIYCISHVETGNTSLSTMDGLSAKEAYKLGLGAVIEKVKATQNKYNELMEFFDHYGNRNYQDTVERALPGFFLHYDVKYAPMENVITMDYPVFGLDMSLEGIDRISQYIDAIWEEQCYLMKFPRSYIVNELRSFRPHYEREFFNIKEIVERQTTE